MSRLRIEPDFRAGMAYFVLGLAATGCYFISPATNAGSAVYDAVGASAVVALLGGVRLHRPGARAPWILFALGTALFVAGDTAAVATSLSGNWTHGLYLAGYPFLAAGILVLIYRAGGHHRLAAIDEAGIATFAFAIIQWVFLMEPALDGAGPVTTRAVNATYTGADIVLLAGFAGLLVSAAWRKPAFLLLVGGVLMLLLGDEVYLATTSSYSDGSAVNAAWLVSYVLFGTAALHPSMRDLSEPRRRSQMRVSTLRIVLLTTALLTPPAVLLIQWAHGKDLDAAAIFSASVVISLLVVWRLAGILRALERLRLREHAVRAEVEEARMLLAEQNEMLREADKLKDEFVSLVSHDLRTPLTSVIGYTELALEAADGLDEERRHYLEVVSRNAERLLRLVDDLLFIARLQAGHGLELNPVQLDLADVARQSVHEAQPRARDKGLDLRYTGAESVPTTADRGRLFQLLDNLVGNAVKFTPAGGLVEVAVEAAGGSVTLEVRDTGIGLDPGDAERLFERFFRTERATHAQIPGTGLGLFIAQAITEAHGGRVSARARDGGGTVICVELPEHAPRRPESDPAELVA